MRHRTVTVDSLVRISFQFWRSRPLQIRGSWRTGQSSASYRPLERATCCPRIARSTVAQSTVGSPDSPMNFSRTPLNFSREQRLRRGRLTGQSGAPPDSPVICSRTPPSSPESSQFTLDLSGAPDSPVHPDRAAVGYTHPTLFQSIFSCF
jgi:hypothetical protein